MQELERWGLAHGFTRLVLESRESNVHAIEFYKKNGYSVCPNYGPYVNEKDAVCMEKLIKA